MKNILHVIIGAGIVLLANCAKDTSVNPESIQATDLGSRVLPGYSVNAKMITSDNETSFLITTGGKPSKVEAAVGSSYDTRSTMVKAEKVAGDVQAFRVAMVLPTGKEQNRLWVKITNDNGAVIESGLDDFPIPANK